MADTAASHSPVDPAALDLDGTFRLQLPSVPVAAAEQARPPCPCPALKPLALQWLAERHRATLVTRAQAVSAQPCSPGPSALQ